MSEDIKKKLQFLSTVYQQLQDVKNAPTLLDYKYNIAAVLFNEGTQVVISAARNDLPESFNGVFPPTEEIGDSGTTIHAEILCLDGAKALVEGASIMVTDPLCPNCMKSVIAAGVKKIYITEDGFTQGNWYNSADENGVERQRYFDDVSLKLAAYAGVQVCKIGGKGGEDVSCDIIQPQEKPPMSKARVEEYDAGTLSAMVCNAQDRGRPYAVAIANGPKQRRYIVMASESYVPGMSDEKAQNIREHFKDVPGGLRYRLKVDALSSILSACAYFGFSLSGEQVYISEIPTSRCIVNAIGAGVKHFGLAHKEALSQKSKYALDAFYKLETHGIVKASVINDIPAFLEN